MQPEHGPRPEASDARPEPVHVLAVGDLAPPYDVDLLLRAFAGVARWNPQVRLVVVGEGPEGAALEARIQALGLEQVVSLAGALAPTRTAELLQRAHVLALVSHPAAGAPGPEVRAVLAAAMASGLCVVATEDAQTARLVVDGLSGLLVTPGDLAALSRALHLVVGSADLRRSLGEAAACAVRNGTRRSA